MSGPTTVCVVLMCLFTSAVCADEPGPPRSVLAKQHHVIDRLNADLESLHRDGLPIRLYYRNIDDIEITIPKQFAAQAERRGITAHEIKSPAMPAEDTRSLMSPRNIIIGLGLTVCCILAFVFFARKPSWLAVVITLVVVAMSAAVAGAVLFLHDYESYAERPIPNTIKQARADIGIAIKIVEAGNAIDVYLPRSEKPAWMGAQDETTYPSPLWRRTSNRGPEDKK